MSKYIVKDVVCDTGIYSVDNEGIEELVEVCNSRTNALKICEILNADLEHKVYKDKQIADLEAKLAEKEKKHIEDKIYLLEFLKANFADVYIYGVMKTDDYNISKYSKDVDSIIDREIRKLKGEW